MRVSVVRLCFHSCVASLGACYSASGDSLISAVFCFQHVIFYPAMRG